MDSFRVAREPLWQWPSGSYPHPEWDSDNSEQETHDSPDDHEASSVPEEKPQTHYPSRICRICLETVPPTLHPPIDNVPGFLQPKPRVVYESPDPELGRLLRPCKCKGSARYVHEGCLSQWRHADPRYGNRNYWRCPTCGFQYRLERLRWARWISSAMTQLALTTAILLFTIFLLGFIADPIINLYVDPVDTIWYTDFWEPSTARRGGYSEPAPSWAEHFLKGLASLGVLSFLKAIIVLSPWHWWNLRSSGLVGGGRSTGRSRAASISWVVLLIGVGSFLWAVYKGVRSWSRRTLEKAGERVMDVPLPDDDDDGAEADAGPTFESTHPSKKHD